jgi:amidase
VQSAKVKWQVYREHMDKFMETHDIIISPGVPYTALAHGHYMTDEENQYALNNLACYSLLGYPAVTIRTGTAPDGMPMGIQIVAKTWDDLTALLVAEYIETNMKGAGYRPPLITQDAIASIWGKDILSSAELSDIGFT